MDARTLKWTHSFVVMSVQKIILMAARQAAARMD
jgi:hypothetical protein